MLAKKGETQAMRSLAKELVNSRKAKERMIVSKAHLNSISMQLRLQMSTLRTAKAFSQSTEVMKSMTKLMSLPEMAATVQEMGFEMEKAGLIQEMMDDVMDEALGDADEDDVDAEVDKVVTELTYGILDSAGPTPVSQPQLAQKGKELLQAGLSEDPEPVAVGAGAAGGDVDDLESRLHALMN